MSESFTIKGTLTQIGEEQTFDSGFRKKEAVVTTLDEKYPQPLKFEFCKDAIDRLDKVAVGDLVDVKFDIRGNEWKGKFYVSLNGFFIRKADGGETQAPAPEPTQPEPETGLPDGENLPF